MSRIYDNWERLVAAVLRKEQLWQLFHAQSRSPSISSESSGYSFSFRFSSSLEDVPFGFSSPEWSASNQKEDDIGSKKTASPIPSSILVENHSPNRNVSFKPNRKRDLKIQVPKVQFQHHDAPESSRVHPRTGGGHFESQANWPVDAKQQSYPLPLPPGATSNSRPNSAVTSPSKAPLRNPERVENVKSPSTPWKKGKLLGRGTLGDVYVGFNSEKGEMCAMKEFSLSSDDAESKQSARMLEREIALLSGLQHPNIVQYYGSEMVGDNFYIYYEYVSGGTIHRILREYGKLGESAIRSYTQQILSGLAYLHSKHIAHRDIRGANILLDPNGKVKLSSFGIEKHMGSRLSSLMESAYWTAPEVIMNPYARNLAIDIWSLGCTVLEMATSKPPISQYSQTVAMFKIASHKELPTIPNHLSDECKDFLRHCLQWNPMHRATASQLLEHPFVKSSLPLEKRLLVSTSSSDRPGVRNAGKSAGIDHARSLHQLDSGRLVIHSSGGSQSNFHSRNRSAPVSPAGSPLRQPRSPQQANRQISPPPVSSPIMASSSSTPLTSEISNPIIYPHLNQSILQQETFRNLPKHSPRINSPSYWDPKILQGLHSGSHDFQEPAFFDNGQRYQQSALADRVSQQLLKAPVKLNPLLI